MSIYKMRTEFGQHFKWILMGIAVIFVVGAIWQFGGAPPSGPEGTQQLEAIAVVNGMGISPREYQAVLDPRATMARDRGVNSTLQFANIKADTLMAMIEGRLLLSAAQKMGVDISQSAVDERYEQKITDFLRENRRRVIEKIGHQQDASDPREDSDYISKLEEYGSSLDQEEEKAREATSRAGLEEEVASEGIRAKLKHDLGRVSGRDMAESQNVYKVRQILVSANLPAQQASNKAKKILSEAKAGKDFATLAKQNSDDITKSKGGEADYSFNQLAGGIDYAAFQLLASGGAMDQAAIMRGVKMLMDNPVTLSRALRSPSLGAFQQTLALQSRMLQIAGKLKPGEISGIIPTDMGLFIVKLESVQTSPAPAMDKKTEKARRDMIRQVRMLSKWMDVDRQARGTAQITVEDPEMAGYFHLSRVQNSMVSGKKDYGKELALAAKSFKRALKERKSNGEAAVKYAQILHTQGKVKEAAQLMYNMLEGSGAPVQGGDLRLWLGDMLLQLKDPKNKDENRKRALIQFRKASDAAVVDRNVHVQLVAKYRQLGMPDLAANEEVLIADIDRKMKVYEEKHKKKPGG